MKNFFIMIGTRIEDIIAKLISIKGVVLGMATYLVLQGAIDGWVWFTCALAVISFRTLEKKIGQINIK